VGAWRHVAVGVRRLWRGAAADRDAADEVAHFLDEAAAAYEQRGLLPDASRRAARLDVAPAATVDALRGYGWENIVVTATRDVQFAVRRLRAEPALTIVIALTLAVGLGATTAIFSAVNPILFASLPYPNANGLASIVEARADGGQNGGTFAFFRELIDRSRTLETIAVARSWQPTLSGAAEPERLDGQRVSASYFSVLGVAPAIGRTFTPSDDRAGAPVAVVLSDALWRRRFNADPAIAGRTVTLDDAMCTVVGVLPASFENVLAPTA